MRRVYNVTLIAALIILVGLLVIMPARAQTSDEIWGEMVNLSNSGSAGQARIVAGEAGLAQAFWLDQYDGLMTAVYADGAWSEGRSAGLGYTGLREMPVFIVDTNEIVHAVWQEAGPGTALWHSRVRLGATNWSMPEIMAEAAVTFDVSAPNTGGISIAYIRPLSDVVYPAGVYVRKWWNEGYWGMARVVDTELYYRQWEAEGAWLRLADTGDGKIVIAWQDIRRDQAFRAISTDYGMSWSPKEPVGEEGSHRNPRVMLTTSGRILLITQLESTLGCSLYQQEFGADGQWGEFEPVLTGLINCPVDELVYKQGNGLVWVWGLGDDQLSLTSWNPETAEWSEIRNLSFSFVDEMTGQMVSLIDQWVVVGGGRIYVTGSSEKFGDVWASSADLDSFVSTVGGATSWSTVLQLSASGKSVDCVSAVVDANGAAHVVWCEAGNSGDSTNLYYARIDEGGIGQVVEVVAAQAGEIVQQPSLLADNSGWLHLVWSGGKMGEIRYSRARIGEPGTVTNWSRGVLISGQVLGSAPQITKDDARNVYVVYSVKVNEGRGIYLVRSTDEGVNWEKPELVFDAESAGVGMVDHPALVVNSHTVHVAWVESAGPDLSPLSIAYTRGVLGESGFEWAKPTVVMGAGFDQPRMEAADGRLHLLGRGRDNGLWARTTLLNEANWGTTIQIPEWYGFGDGKFGLSATGPAYEGGESMLHLVGASQDGLSYEVWEEGRWKKVEDEQVTGLKVTDVSASTLRQGGKMVVAFIAEDMEGLEGVYLVTRDIGLADLGVPPTEVPSSIEIATVTPSPTETQTPTSTPDLNLAPAPGSSLPIPLIMAGGLALLVVVMGLLWGLRDKVNWKSK